MIKHTETEMKLVRRYVELQYVLDVLEEEKKRLLVCDLRVKDILIKKLDSAQENAIKTMQTIRQTFRQNGIKIYEQNKTDVQLETKYLCRGYHHRMLILWSKMRYDVLGIIEKLL